MIIRCAEVSDIANIVSLHVRSWRENYTQSLSATFLKSSEVEVNRLKTWTTRLNEPSPNQYVIIAEANNNFAGFLCVYLDRHPILGSLIDNLHVEPNLRKQGVATQLMSHAANWINMHRSNGAVYLEAYAENIRAHKFYSGLAGIKTTDQPFPVLAIDGGQALSFHFKWDSVASLIAACAIKMA